MQDTRTLAQDMMPPKSTYPYYVLYPYPSLELESGLMKARQMVIIAPSYEKPFSHDG